MIANTLHILSSTRSRVAQIFLLTSLLALLVPGAATAAPPTDKFEVIVVDEAFVDAFLTEQCGFTVLHTIEGTVKLSGSRNETGELIADMARISLTHTWIGPSGASLTSPDVGVDRITYNADGSVTAAANGIFLRIVVPGEGLVVAYIGHRVTVLTFDPVTGAFLSAETIVEAGQQPRDFDVDEQMTAICTALAG